MFKKIISKPQFNLKPVANVFLKPQPLLTKQQPIRNYCCNHTHNHILPKAQTSQISQIINNSNRTFKTKVSVKKRCADCYFVRRKGVLKVYCKKFPRHKQRQG